MQAYRNLTVPNDFGEDPWWIAASQSDGDISDDRGQYLAAYLLARAFGFRSNNQAELIRFAFDQVYLPALQSRLSREAWSIIEPRLPRSWASWIEWDICQRLRDVLVEAFIDRDLSPSTFTDVTKDDEVFAQLAEAAARTGRGRRFLRRATQSLMNQDRPSRRIKMLEGVT
jgi:hypothetical protein